MAQGGAVCSDVSLKTGSTVSGALNPFAECSGVSSGDTAIVMVKDHASAVAYASNMLNVGQSLGPAAEVVGPSWAVNTVPGFANKVVNAVGGQLMAEPSTAPSASPAPQSSAPAAPTMTRQVDTIVFKVTGSGYPSVQYGSDSKRRNLSELPHTTVGQSLPRDGCPRRAKPWCLKPSIHQTFSLLRLPDIKTRSKIYGPDLIN